MGAIMKNILLVVLAFFFVGFTFWLFLTKTPGPTMTSIIISNPTSTTTLSICSTSTTIAAQTSHTNKEIGSRLIKVVTLYQKGEGESDLAAYASRGMAYELKGEAVFSQVNTLDDPQAAVFYGVIEHPTVVFISAGGKVLYKHQGYLEKDEVVGILNNFKSR
jgi:hypothetical protein